MVKTALANGMSYVEISEAGLSILCGCPENAVKFLAREGLIREVERGGFHYETGPNAILLSEMPVQGGRFRNLGEFPVLQMLYRQGMIIPGHPSNTGLRPMIIGMRDQVEAQSRYIYSGNYGLASVEELVAAGLGPERAAEFLRMKLWFAYGSIRKTEELLDLRVFDAHAIELRGGAFVRRIAPNHYEFFHEGQTVEVDLSPGPSHELPYELPRRSVTSAHFSVVHIGEGDGWDRTRPCMASLLQFAGDLYLIDAGPDIEASLDAIGIGINDLRGVFHTHAHDDHFVGLTALLRAEKRLRYYAVPWVRESVEAKLRALIGIGEREFRRYFDVHDLLEGEWNDVDGLEVMPTMTPHPVEDTVFRFRVRGENGYRSYAHLADLASFAVIDSMVARDASLPGISAESAGRFKAAYLERADVKKADVGGGMIHGSADDFARDESGKLLLSHGIGSLPASAGRNASIARFGDEDILVASRPSLLGGSGSRRAGAARPAPAAATETDALGEIDEISSFLRWNAPFADLSTAALMEIAAAARFERIPEGRSLATAERPAVRVLIAGRARIAAGGKTVGALGPGDFFGEESLLVEGPGIFDAVALESLEDYRIPAEAIEERPILLWRLREKLESRLTAVKSVFNFSWRPGFSVGEPEIDVQHQRLFALIGRLDAAVSSPESCPDSSALVQGLVEFARLHFATEEGFMRRGGYPALAAHAREHESLLREVEAIGERIDCGDDAAVEGLDRFLKDWALKHTLLIDRQYMRYLPSALVSRIPSR